MNNCYFCHRPTAERIYIQWKRYALKGGEYVVTEYVHSDCLENALRWFVEPEPRFMTKYEEIRKAV